MHECRPPCIMMAGVEGGPDRVPLDRRHHGPAATGPLCSAALLRQVRCCAPHQLVQLCQVRCSALLCSAALLCPALPCSVLL